MDNLSITLHLKTPIITGKYPLNLDGLLYWAAFEGSFEVDEVAQQIVAKALACEQGIYKSSDMIYLQTPQGVIASTTAAFTTSMNWREFNYKTDKKSIMEQGGKYRSRLTTYNSIMAQAVRFYAQGDADLIRFLIDSAGFVGCGNNQGHGEISEIVIEKIDNDLSWYESDESGHVSLNRCLPADVVASIPKLAESLASTTITLVRVKPPYPQTQDFEGYSTTFKRSVLTAI